MRLLLAAVLALALAWGGYWWIGSGREKAAISGWLETDQRISASGHQTSGFPNRFDTTFQDLRIDLGSVVWTIPRAQIFRLSYRAGDYRIWLDEVQRFHWADTHAILTTESALASAALADGALAELNLILTAPRLVFEGDEALAGARAQLALRSVDDAHEVYAELSGLPDGGDLVAQGRLTIADGQAKGTLQISLDQPAEIAGIEIEDGDELGFADGLLYLNAEPLGPAPQVPF